MLTTPVLSVQAPAIASCPCLAHDQTARSYSQKFATISDSTLKFATRLSTFSQSTTTIHAFSGTGTRTGDRRRVANVSDRKRAAPSPRDANENVATKAVGFASAFGRTRFGGRVAQPILLRFTAPIGRG